MKEVSALVATLVLVAGRPVVPSGVKRGFKALELLDNLQQLCCMSKLVCGHHLLRNTLPKDLRLLMAGT